MKETVEASKVQYERKEKGNTILYHFDYSTGIEGGQGKHWIVQLTIQFVVQLWKPVEKMDFVIKNYFKVQLLRHGEKNR